MPNRVFGHIPGVEPGAWFESRNELARAGVHRPNQAGISGSATEGADSIVVSGGYVDDEDFGNVIIYTGHGGNDPNSRRQLRDQELTEQNLALAVSCDSGLPVRVSRGSRHRSPWSPAAGYTYAGLYRIDRYWHETGRDGYRIWRYRLEAIDQPIVTLESDQDIGQQGATRVETVVQRIVRSTAVAARVKAIHQHQCQICGQAIRTRSGLYSEAAHIRPLGRPHDGDDLLSNVLCLCPNHHTMLDLGGCIVDDDLRVIDLTTGETIGRIRMDPRHMLDMEAFRYHRSLFDL